MKKRCYVVTAKVKSKGYRDDVTIPMTKKQAEKSKKNLEADMKSSIPRYRWATQIRVENKCKRD